MKIIANYHHTKPEYLPWRISQNDNEQISIDFLGYSYTFIMDKINPTVEVRKLLEDGPDFKLTQRVELVGANTDFKKEIEGLINDENIN